MTILENKYPLNDTTQCTMHEWMQKMQAHAKTTNAVGGFVVFMSSDGEYHTYYYDMNKQDLEYMVDSLVEWVETLT